MKIVHSNLSELLGDLIDRCVKLEWAVAWASSKCPVFKKLKHSSNRRKINRLTVGTHFWQTDPKFMEHFLDEDSVHFVIDEQGIQGVFHPKIYFFEHKDGSWDCIVGSPNFTEAAMLRNDEVAMHFRSTDQGSDAVESDVRRLLKYYWEERGRQITAEELAKYASVRARKIPALDRLSRSFASNNDDDRISEYTSWTEYLSILNRRPKAETDNRLLVLDTARDWLTDRSFGQLTYDERSSIAGFAKHGGINWYWFGHMTHPAFKTAVKSKYQQMSDALDEIPISGTVERHHYENYLRIISGAYTDPAKATVSRLLCMKRPDYFPCINNMNIERATRELRITEDVTPANYWDQVIVPIMDSNWWNGSSPANAKEARIWKCRAAMLDVLWYQHV